MQTEENRFVAAERLKLGRPEGRAIERVREAIRNQTFESAFAWDARGNLVAARDGDKIQVFFPLPEWRGMRNGVLLHNHPEGVSFSIKDLLRVKEYQLARMEAVTKRFLYIVQSPDNGWGCVSEKIWGVEIKKLAAKHQEIRDDLKYGILSTREAEEEMHEATKAFRIAVRIRYGRLEG